MNPILVLLLLSCAAGLGITAHSATTVDHDHPDQDRVWNGWHGWCHGEGNKTGIEQMADRLNITLKKCPD